MTTHELVLLVAVICGFVVLVLIGAEVRKMNRKHKADGIWDNCGIADVGKCSIGCPECNSAYFELENGDDKCIVECGECHNTFIYDAKNSVLVKRTKGWKNGN